MDYKKIIATKLQNKALSYDAIKYMVNSYVENKISDEKMTEFIKVIYDKGLTFKETLYLTDIMIKSGTCVDLSQVKKPTVDKHSTGGVGDKTSLIILPICASLNVAVPKMSGRSLGITGGTVDKLESIPGFKSNLRHNKFIEILNEVGCADICQSKDIAIADKKIYALRDKTGYVDSIPLIASSIMSKKIACSCKYIIIDLKVGKGAFMKDIKSASKLARLMIKIGKYYNRKVICILSDMSSPLGNNIGNILEVKEAINFFNKKYDQRLYELVVSLSSYMIFVSRGVTVNRAKKVVVNSIESNRAKIKFYEWIKAQGGILNEMKMNAKRIDVKSVNKGYIKSIDASILGEISTKLSHISKNNKSVGIIIKKSIGDFVERDEIICSIYYTEVVDNMISKVRDSFELTDSKPKKKNIILKVIK